MQSFHLPVWHYPDLNLFPLQRRAYKLKEWTDAEDFLMQLANQSGRLLRGGEPDLNTTAKMVLYDWQRGKIPYFHLPPDYVELAGKPGVLLTVRFSYEGAAFSLIRCMQAFHKEHVSRRTRQPQHRVTRGTPRHSNSWSRR